MTHVLRVQRSDDPAAFVLFHVQQNGTEPLDLRIVGTDGELPFITETKQRTVKSLRSSNNTAADNDDWASVLSAILLQHDASHTILKGLETVASVAGDQSTMTLSIRRNIDGITVGDAYQPICSRTSLIYIATPWCRLPDQTRRRGN